MLDSRVELAWCNEEEEEGLLLENEYVIVDEDIIMMHSKNE